MREQSIIMTREGLLLPIILTGEEAAAILLSRIGEEVLPIPLSRIEEEVLPMPLSRITEDPLPMLRTGQIIACHLVEEEAGAKRGGDVFQGFCVFSSAFCLFWVLQLSDSKLLLIK